MMGRLATEKPFSRHSINSYGNGESGQQSDMNLAKPRQTLVPRKPEIVDVSVPLGTRVRSFEFWEDSNTR